MRVEEQVPLQFYQQYWCGSNGEIVPLKAEGFPFAELKAQFSKLIVAGIKIHQEYYFYYNHCQRHTTTTKILEREGEFLLFGYFSILVEQECQSFLFFKVGNIVLYVRDLQVVHALLIKHVLAKVFNMCQQQLFTNINESL